jgi:FKBP-type peptidyl-prolyl cis-trans isomerase FkpA
MTVRRSVLPFFLLIPLVLMMTGCGGGEEPAAPTTPTTPSPTGPATLQLTDLSVGSGGEAVAGTTVVVHYTLWLYDPAGTDSKGTRLQSSRDANNPFPFRLGTNAVIPGFEQAVTGMKVGGTRRAIVPPTLAYGSTGSGSIPPNTWLVFEIELLSVAS